MRTRHCNGFMRSRMRRSTAYFSINSAWELSAAGSIRPSLKESNRRAPQFAFCMANRPRVSRLRSWAPCPPGMRRELQRWRIDEKLLPPGSTVLYRTPGLWEQHRALIIGGISICVVETLLIAGLVVNRIRRRHAELSLSESEDRVALAADAAQLGVWEIDAATNKVWVSDKVRDLFQIAPRTDVDYAAFHERVHPDDQRLRDSAIKRAIETKGGYEIEYRILLPDGTVRWISGRARCISDGDG